MLLKAYLLSILFHFMVIASMELLHYYGFTEKGPVSSLLAPKMPDLNAAEEEQELEINLDKEPEPTIFFDADPSLATEEKPEDTPYYAVIDSIAGNPDILKIWISPNSMVHRIKYSRPPILHLEKK
jgi:hypothetical protein